jgi:WD40 repeat protein
MKRAALPAIAILAALGCALRGQDATTSKPALTIPLPGVEGRIDHMAFDPTGGRFFVAALGNNTIEVVDTSAGRVIGRIASLHKPQGIAYAADLNKLFVASDADGTCRIYDGTSLKPVNVVELKDDADNVRYDAAAGRVYVGYGEGALAVIDAKSGRKLADVPLVGHPESFQLEARGPRIFVNVPSDRHIAVVDRERRAVIATWSLGEAQGNFPMALDDANHRLFVGCRTPARLLVLDTASGKTVAALDCCGDTDDLFYDAVARRIYVSGGEGCVSVFRQISADRYEPAERIATAAGARTSFFVARDSSLYVAVPRRGAQQAELRVYKMPAGP